MSRGKTQGEHGVARWFALRDAAPMISLTAGALRKKFERNARRAADGGTEADIDGVHGRKFGNLWRVRFSEAWTE